MNDSLPHDERAGSFAALLDAEPVHPMDYQVLRLMAETASGMRNQELEFRFRGHALVRVPPPAGIPEGGVDVPARTRGKIPAIDSVWVNAAPEAPGFDLVAAGADAVFWSEAAVEKFLVPYYASCAGSRAATFLHDFLRAWNEPWKGVHVLALMHRGRVDQNEPLSLSRTVGVLFRRDGSQAVEMKPLLEFLAGVEAGAAPEPESVQLPLAQGGPVPLVPPHPPTYGQLRAIAEWGSSLRERPVYFVYDVEAGTYVAADAPPPAEAGTVVIPAYTPPVLPGRETPAGVWIRPGRGEPVDVRVEGDAMFWSTGAIEQFLFPYYASVGGTTALDELAELYRAWWGNDAPPHHQTDARVEGEEGEVYSVVHLPKSDWVVESEPAPTLEEQVGVLVRSPVSRELELITFGEYGLRYRRGR